MSDEKVRAKRWTRINAPNCGTVVVDSKAFQRWSADGEIEGEGFCAAHNVDADRMNAYAERLEGEVKRLRKELDTMNRYEEGLADGKALRDGLQSRAEDSEREVERLKRELANWRTRAEAAEGKLADSGLAQSFDAPAPPAPKALEALMWRANGKTVMFPHKLTCWIDAMADNATSAGVIADVANASIRAAYDLDKAETERLRVLLSERDAAIERLEADLGKAEAAKDDGKRWTIHWVRGGNRVAAFEHETFSDVGADAICQARDHVNRVHIYEARPVEPKRWRLRVGDQVTRSYSSKDDAGAEANVLFKSWGLVGELEEMTE